MGATEEGQETAIRFFCSYSHHDEELRRQLEDQLAALRWSGLIAVWHDRKIYVGRTRANLGMLKSIRGSGVYTSG